MRTARISSRGAHCTLHVPRGDWFPEEPGLELGSDPVGPDLGSERFRFET